MNLSDPFTLTKPSAPGSSTLSPTKTMNPDFKPLAPDLVIETLWEHDNDSRFSENGMTAPGGCFHGQDPNDWQAWESEVRVTAIVNGAFVTGSAYLGGTWEEYGINPADTNPEINSYFPQMLDEALCELGRQLPGESPLHKQVKAILEKLIQRN